MKRDPKKVTRNLIEFFLGFILLSASIIAIIFIVTEGFPISLLVRVLISIGGYLLICSIMLTVIVYVELKSHKNE